MGIRLENVIVRMRQGREAEVSFTVMPTGTNTEVSGKANVPQHLIDNLKHAAHELKRAIDDC
jgi:hypothetical protein